MGVGLPELGSAWCEAASGEVGVPCGADVWPWSRPETNPGIDKSRKIATSFALIRSRSLFRTLFSFSCLRDVLVARGVDYDQAWSSLQGGSTSRRT